MDDSWGGWAEWGPPLGVMIAAIAFGWLTISRSQSRADPEVERQSRLLDLKSVHDEALQALKQLEFDKDKLPAEEYQQERERLMRRGARALEALDSPDLALQILSGRDNPAPDPAARPAAAIPAASGPLAGLSPEWRGALYTLAGVVLVFILWNFAGGYEKPKDPGMGAPQATGPGEQPGALTERGNQVLSSPVFKQEVAQQEALLQANPNDLAALNQLTYLYLIMADHPQMAFGYNEQAIKLDPKNFDARAYRAVLTAMMSMLDKALAMLDEVLAESPDHEKSIVYRSMILVQMSRKDEALASLQGALAKNPSSQQLSQALAALQQVPNGGPGDPGAGAPAAPGQRLAAGTISLDPAAQSALQQGGVLFLSIRNPAMGQGGPPVAADRRMPPFQFPMPFELTTAHIRAMGAGEVPAVIDVTARLDLDGNPSTKDGPAATAAGVQTGAEGLSLVLSFEGAAPAPGGGLLAPLPGAPGSPAPAGASELIASGTATLDASLQSQLTGSEMVFVSVKDPSGGPPLAAVQMPARFPLQFNVTSANVIQMGPSPRTVPETVVVSVRVDRDGNAMTKDGGPEAVMQGVKKGSSALNLVLQ